MLHNILTLLKRAGARVWAWDNLFARRSSQHEMSENGRNKTTKLVTSWWSNHMAMSDPLGGLVASLDNLQHNNKNTHSLCWTILKVIARIHDVILHLSGESGFWLKSRNDLEGWPITLNEKSTIRRDLNWFNIHDGGHCPGVMLMSSRAMSPLKLVPRTPSNTI